MVLAPSLVFIGLSLALLPQAAPTAIETKAQVRPTVELPVTPWSAGDVIHSEARSHSTLHTIIVSNGQVIQEFDQVEDKSAEKTIRVLASDERGPTRLRVDYGALHFFEASDATRSTEGQDTHPEIASARNPLEHQTFYLVRKGGSYRVLDARGKRVDEGLAQLVLEEECLHENSIRRAGDLVARELAGRPLALGVEIECTRESARAFVDGHDHLDNVRLTLVPKETRSIAGASVVVVTAHLEIADAGGGDQPATSVDLEGELRFDLATGRFLAVELAGKLSLAQATADETRGIEVTGDGPWTIHENVTYERAP